MTVRSYISLCVAGIIYVIMAATAVLSPHGSSYALGNANNQLTTPLTGMLDTMYITDEANDIRVPLTLEGMPAFTSTNVTVTVDGKPVTFRAVEFRRVLTFSALNLGDVITVKCKDGQGLIFTPAEMMDAGGVYICYADENNTALSEDVYGRFCLAVINGTKAGLIKNIESIDVG